MYEYVVILRTECEKTFFAHERIIYHLRGCAKYVFDRLDLQSFA
jgi:hypothetical protein